MASYRIHTEERGQVKERKKEQRGNEKKEGKRAKTTEV
jgi:hypothetical protein